MKQAIKFFLARWLGKPHSRVLPIKDGVEPTITGHVWRGTFYASEVRNKIVNPVAYKNAIMQAMGGTKVKGGPRILTLNDRRRR